MQKKKSDLNSRKKHDAARSCGENYGVWFDDYEDRVLFDEAGLYEYSRVDKKKVEIKQTADLDTALSQK